ncbi:uncharacterized protein DS421_7g218170 [Arachis hypogaea]|nr:uncharacterized protein DS421_7g218170 [Arachis hypogaea]
MEGPVTILAPQAASLVNPRVLIQPIAVRTRGPEISRSVLPLPLPRVRILVRRNLVPRGGRRRVISHADIHPVEAYGVTAIICPGAWAWPWTRPRSRSTDRELVLLDPAGNGEVDSGEEGELLVVVGLLDWVREHRPGVGNELKGVVGVRKAALVRVEEESEAAVVALDEVEVVGAAVHLEDAVPIELVVVGVAGGGVWTVISG